ncbi:hypothetical protein P3T36_004358 [Kitasatospora sp. MAP12-15]|uniref:hypothetical protein n=1 Tax=unclassified Kitasatospora TaxID=2633591 RepID=UPI002475AA1D|nr:hypothetical protein [Kitasatospora sp. MAP12-44]MDH6108177.1 hypothetical protein [Kitasatospora sp. MAP12-44]
MLRRADDLHKLLRPEVRELVDGRIFNKDYEHGTFESYSRAAEAAEPAEDQLNRSMRAGAMVAMAQWTGSSPVTFWRMGM